MLRAFRLLLGALLLLQLTAPARAANEPITILTQQDVYNDYIRFIDNRDPLTLNHFDGQARAAMWLSWCWCNKPWRWAVCVCRSSW